MNQKNTCIIACTLLSFLLFDIPALHTIADPVISNVNIQKKIFNIGLPTLLEPGN